MNKPKYLIFDLDGTLLNSDHKISQKTIDALYKAQEHGIKVTIATGRSYLLSIDEMREINATGYAIVCNGALIYDIQNKSFIENCRPFNETFKDYFFEHVKRLQSGFLAYSTDTSYFFGYSKESKLVFQPFLKGSLDLSNLSFEKMRDVLLKENIYAFSHQTNTIGHDDFMELFKDLKENKKMCNMSSALNGVVDIYGYNISKAAGFKRLSELLGVSKEDVYYFGDSMNDYEIASLIPNSVAMGNGVEKLKSVCKYQIGDNNSTAIADFVYKLLEN